MSDPIDLLVERNRALDRAERAEQRIKELERERDEARPVLEAARYQAMIHGSKIAYREACYQTELAISSFDAARAAAKEVGHE